MSKWPLIIGTAVLAAALGVFAWVTDAPAYLGSNSDTCNNCHVMDAAYENYYHAAHERWAECADCHIPHDNFIHYYFYKGKSGMHDVYIFSTGQTPELIRATQQTDEIVQANCIRCHTGTVESIVLGAQPFDRYCWDCHRSVAHGKRGSSASLYQDSVLYPNK